MNLKNKKTQQPGFSGWISSSEGSELSLISYLQVKVGGRFNVTENSFVFSGIYFCLLALRLNKKWQNQEEKKFESALRFWEDLHWLNCDVNRYLWKANFLGKWNLLFSVITCEQLALKPFSMIKISFCLSNSSYFLLLYMSFKYGNKTFSAIYFVLGIHEIGFYVIIY